MYWASPEGEGSGRENAAHTENAASVWIMQLDLSEFVSSYGFFELIMTSQSRISEGVITIDEFGQRAIFTNEMGEKFNTLIIH